MSPVDYVIDILLTALVLRQIRRQPLTPGSIILPAVLIVAAGLNYLRPFRIGENDLALLVLLTASRHCAGHVQRTRDSSLARRRCDHVSGGGCRRTALDCRHGWTLRLRVLQHPWRP